MSSSSSSESRAPCCGSPPSAGALAETTELDGSHAECGSRDRGRPAGALFGKLARAWRGQEYLRHRVLHVTEHRAGTGGLLARAPHDDRVADRWPHDICSRGSVFIAGAAIQWLRDGLGLLAHAAESETMARSVPDTAGVYFVAGLRRARRPVLGHVRARDDRRAHARNDRCAPGPRGARGHRLPEP